MKRILVVLILIAIIALTLSTFVGCLPTHAYLIDGVYECENISYDGKNIDKITIGVTEITGSEYDKYDEHIIHLLEKAYYIDYDIWIDGEQNKEDYRANYMFKLRCFYIGIRDEDENIIELKFTTDKEDDNYFLRATIYMFNDKEYRQKEEELLQLGEDPSFRDIVVISDEIILKKYKSN